LTFRKIVLNLTESGAMTKENLNEVINHIYKLGDTIDGLKRDDQEAIWFMIRYPDTINIKTYPNLRLLKNKKYEDLESFLVELVRKVFN
jgi:hypothetical protein